MPEPPLSQPRALLGAAFSKLPPQLQRSTLHALGRYAPWERQFDRRAPDAGPGLLTGPPDFVGVGVQKAGTSWWFDLLAGHPGAYHHSDFHKERHFFTHRFLEPLDDEGIAAYHRWFPRPPGRVTGEWTPDYLHQHWALPMIATAAPRAKLLVLLRDPVERYRSGLDHHRQRGERLDAAIATDAFARGLYGLQLERLERTVAREQVLVLLYEECRDDPAGQLRRTLCFLGLDEEHVPASLGRPVSATAARHPLEPRQRDELAERYEDDLARLAALRPDLDLGRWPAAARLSGRG